MGAREILYLNVSTFRIEVERVVSPGLRERPVALALPHSARSTLLEVSREARAEGIAEGMPLGLALRVCRGLTVIPPNPGLYDKAAEALGGLVSRYTPLWEPHRPGHLYLDMSGSRRLFGPPRDVAWRVEKDLEKDLALRASLGVAANKLVSRIAARTVSPRGIVDIEHGSEATFMAPLSVRFLPGVGDVRVQSLFDELNVTLIGQIAAIPLPHLRMVFGAFAVVLQQRAIGVDPEPVRPPVRRPATEESITLADDTNDDPVLLGHLYSLVEQAAARMRAAGILAGEIVLTVRHSDGDEVVRKTVLPVPSFWDFDLFPAVEKLYFKATGRRTRVRHVKIAFIHRDRGAAQLLLALDEPVDGSARRSQLVEALDRIRHKHGYEAVRFGRVPPQPAVRQDDRQQHDRNGRLLPLSTTPALLPSPAARAQLLPSQERKLLCA